MLSSEQQHDILGLLVFELKEILYSKATADIFRGFSRLRLRPYTDFHHSIGNPAEIVAVISERAVREALRS